MSVGSKTQDLPIAVAIQAYQDMVCMGQERVHQLYDGHNRIQLPPGGVMMNAASYLVVEIDYLERFIDGWYTGIARMTFDAVTIGEWRQFQFNIHNSDAPSVVHFKPCAFLAGWQAPDIKLDQHIYSFSIRPYSASQETQE